ncbi:hypothetical protein PV04_01989 [Phialophora macrospora]|uniref:Lactate/malate dehydrogenase N-terminal domain-containing protein n=1 Tax=Phialophora macrospora TaxID=1851006 RepID=A0A0D2GND8_9EURO|nr:hypothetical protein PV04_01989 [Phialophora macrospora]
MPAFTKPQPPPSPTKTRIAIIGTGSVGSAIAYALLHGSRYSDLLLVDVRHDKRDAQVRDLSDAACAEGSSTRVRAATLRDAGGCDVVVIAAGVKRRRGESAVSGDANAPVLAPHNRSPIPGETRVQQLERTSAILRHIIDGMKPFFLPTTILLIVSNPVDVLTTLAYRLADLPSSQVLGLGTYLDTVRLRRIIAEELKISPESVHADILGTPDYGPQAEFPAWSKAVISGIPISESPMTPTDFDALTEAELAARSRKEGLVVTDVKGAPTFSIASSVARIISAIIYDNKSQIPLFGRLPDQAVSLSVGPMPISHFQEELGCCVSSPAFLGREGVVRPAGVKLQEPEEKKLVGAGVTVGETVERLMEHAAVGGKEEE